MENQNHSQLELFSQVNEYGQNNNRRANSFFSKIRSYEKLIILTISFLVTAVVAFSLGVEKGKRLAISTISSHFDLAASSVPKPQYQPAPIQPNIATSPETKSYIQNYTIQVASFTNKTAAQKEAEFIKKKGHTPLILSKGKYMVLCVGKFTSRETALSLLPEFKKRYHDCTVRRL